MNLLSKIISVFFSIISIFFLGKLVGKNNEKQKQLENLNNNLIENARINKEVNNDSFANNASFLLKKQKHNK